MMGIADFITLANGLLGVAAILFIILAVEKLQNPYFSDGVKTNYIWGAMTCILLSVAGDIIDGPVARKYSKRKLLGGTLDVMSDCISFCVAPALLMFVMFGRWGKHHQLGQYHLALRRVGLLLRECLGWRGFITKMPQINRISMGWHRRPMQWCW